MSQRANKPKGESARYRGRTNQGAKDPGANKPGGEPVKGRKSHNSV